MPQKPGSYPADERARGEEPSPPTHLIRLHRHSLTNVLVIGGTVTRRDQVARSFHRESPLRGSPFVAVDCSIDEEGLRAALHEWTQPAAGEPEVNPLSAAEHGTLFLDSIERLSLETQRMLLALARRLLGEPLAKTNVPIPGRLVVGNAQPLTQAVSEGRFLAPLYDALDKVRVELEQPTSEETA
jgi:two-component system response regulator HydG